MNSFRRLKGLGFHLKQLLCLILSTGMVLIGFQVTVAVAQVRAPGQPYVNCGTAPSDIERLESLAAGMQKSIDQQASLLKRADAESRKAWEKADEAARKFKHDQIVNALKGSATSYFTLMKRARLLKLKGLNRQQRRIWFESLKALEEHENLYKSFQAGYAYGDPRLGADTKTALDKVTNIWKTLEDSGIAAEVAKEGAGAVFGPFGKAVVGLSLASLDVVVTSEVAWVEADVARTAQRHLDVMEQVQDRYKSEIHRLSSLKADYCDLKTPAPEDRILVKPDVTPPTAVKRAPAGKKSGVGGALLIGGAVAAGAVAIGLAAGGLGGLDSGGGTNTCSTRDCNPISGCTGSSNTTCPGGIPTAGSGGSCRNNATGQRTAWCPVGLTCCQSGTCGSC